MRNTAICSRPLWCKWFSFGVSFFLYKQALLCLVVRGGGFGRPWDPSTEEILTLLRALTYEAEQTWDLSRHGAARAYPWLSMSLPIIGNCYSHRVSSRGAGTHDWESPTYVHTLSTLRQPGVARSSFSTLNGSSPSISNTSLAILIV